MPAFAAIAPAIIQGVQDKAKNDKATMAASLSQIGDTIRNYSEGVNSIMQNRVVNNGLASGAGNETSKGVPMQQAQQQNNAFDLAQLLSKYYSTRM